LSISILQEILHHQQKILMWRKDYMKQGWLWA